MKELFVETRAVEDEEGRVRRFDYYVVVGEMEMDGRFACESYGIKVEEQGGDCALLPNLTVSVARIDDLVERMTRNTVGPAGAHDVVEDWL